MEITPIQGLQVILNSAHEANFPKKHHDDLDEIARFIAGKLAVAEKAEKDAASAAPAAPGPVDKTVAQFTPKGGEKPARTKRGKIESVS